MKSPLRQSRAAVRTRLGPGVLVVAILLVAAAYGLFGQSDAHPAFQSVSIKRNTSDWSERFQHPMGMSVNASLLLLIQFAYPNHENPGRGQFSPLPASQVVGGPAWINSEGYDIEAKPGANTDPKQEWLMWQTLLADQFKLRLHRETRELAIYDLTVVEGGPKLPAAKEVVCIPWLPDPPKPPYRPGKVEDCGYIAGPIPGPRAAMLRLEGRKVHMAELIRELALALDRPVLDKTEFSGEFDLNLTFTC